MKNSQNNTTVKISRMENISDGSNDRNVFDLQELTYDMQHLFDAITLTVQGSDSCNTHYDLKNIIQTLAKAGSEKAAEIERHF